MRLIELDKREWEGRSILTTIIACISSYLGVTKLLFLVQPRDGD